MHIADAYRCLCPYRFSSDLFVGNARFVELICVFATALTRGVGTSSVVVFSQTWSARLLKLRTRGTKTSPVDVSSPDLLSAWPMDVRDTCLKYKDTTHFDFCKKGLLSKRLDWKALRADATSVYFISVWFIFVCVISAAYIIAVCFILFLSYVTINNGYHFMVASLTLKVIYRH